MRNRADYLIRLIEAAAQVLAALRTRILGGKSSSAEVQQQLRQAAGLVGMNLDIARAATPEMQELMITPSGEIDGSKCYVTAEILYLDGLDATLEPDYDRARESWDRALRLFRLIEPRGSFLVGWPEASERIADIESRLATFPGEK